MRLYPHFTLTRGSSPGFGSMSADLRPLQTRFRFGSGLLSLNLARRHHSPVHSTKGTPSHGHAMLRLIVGTRFQVLFHSAPAVLFTFPSRYYPLSVAREYLALGGGPPRFPRGSSGPAVLGCLPRSPVCFAYGALTLSGRPSHAVLLQTGFLTPRVSCSLPPAGPATPPHATAATFTTCGVWAPPLSLATTHGIAVAFFSSGY
jgi:hypothetical protein